MRVGTLPASAVPRREAVRWRRPAAQALGVFLALLTITVVLYALPVIGRLGSSCVGSCVRDFKLYVWSLDWFRYALAHGLNPFHTPLIWAPVGTSLTWVTTLPAPSLAMLPITWAFGPVAAANVLLLLAPPLAGWAMYLVCREVTGRFLPAAFGGAVLAFSTYVGQLMRAQLNLLLMFWAPLGLYLYLRFLDRRLSRRAFVLLLAPVLVGEFLTSTEVFATMTFCGGLAFVAFWWRGSADLRGRLTDSLVPLAIAYAAAGAVLLPLMISTLSQTPDVVLRPLEQNSVDLVGFVVPGASTIGGGLFRAIGSRFLDQDNFGYIGLPFLALIVAFAWEARKRAGTWPLLALLAVLFSLSMGPRLHILGQRNLWLPTFFVSDLPLLQHAVPERYVLYAWIVLAVIVAAWLAGSDRGWWRFALVALGIVLVWPSHFSVRDEQRVYHQPLVTPAFFTDGSFRRSVAPGEVILAVPSHVGDELMWQVRSDMGFRLASAYIGPTKPKNGLGNLSQEDPPPRASDFDAALASSGARVVVAGTPVDPAWDLFLREATGSPAILVDGVAVYRVSVGPG